ncbi:carboxymuconolactone decarboxylase family protein [Paraflavitalea pollutisoli]|uniref:carboxymuconolactone decarboxylase family protein n=1 Tax=Paraflavitalea pollutisoli TaxID=3034143 RepID=UPI0023EB6D7C|nr:carboxymuconolactone decarboxylase family protein [Paraflavitalea sp. H1-2-19X]
MKPMKAQIIKFTAILLLGIATAGNLTAQNNSKVQTTLTPLQRHLIAVGAETAQGDLPRLKQVLSAGLDSGLTINQAKEAIVHLYAYCGFPRSIRGLQTLMTVLEERKAKGITDEPGRTASPISDTSSKYERGRKLLTQLTGAPQNRPTTGYGAFAPAIDVFLKEHLFADLFERDVLSHAERELVTISVLSSIGGVEPMLNSHFNICLNVGITPAQLQEFIGFIGSTVGSDAASSAQAVLEAVLKDKAR